MSFLGALKEKLKNVKLFGVLAPEELVVKRVEICNSCDFLQTTRSCAKCGCFVDAKAKLQSSHCPLDKW